MMFNNQNLPIDELMDIEICDYCGELVNFEDLLFCKSCNFDLCSLHIDGLPSINKELPACQICSQNSIIIKNPDSKN
ncbi:MAG: hypothetical protein VXX61_05840 [Asgard group archaeon]|jgi:hypothetical protein|nr:hypothetical protein [Asgard group archaeon]